MKYPPSQRRRPTKKRVTVNGRRLAPGLQAPVWTALEKEVEQQGTDVSNLLRALETAGKQAGLYRGPETRTVQLSEKSLALSLEPIVWRSVEYVAIREGTTTEDLINKVADEVLRKRLYDALWAFTTTYVRIIANADLVAAVESSGEAEDAGLTRPRGNALKRALAAFESSQEGSVIRELHTVSNYTHSEFEI